MTIIDFRSVGNKRLALGGIKSISITPVNKLQMILGTNGRGKSTVMSEMSALAANHTAYERGGYKLTHHFHKGHTYECLSDFREAKNNYSIVKDGITLYSGHSSEAYQALVFQEFGLTRELHDIRTGRKRWTGMSVDERRKWFTKIAPEDYTYAIDYYKRLASATRDITGTINRLNVKLMQERSKLIDEAAADAMRQDIKALASQKSEMMQYWRPMEKSVNMLMQDVYKIDDQLLEMSEGFTQSLRIFSNAQGFKSQTDIWAAISEKQARLMFLKQSVSDLCEKISVNRDLLEQAKQASGQDLETINRELGEVSRAIISVSLVVFSDDWKGRAKEALGQYEAIYASTVEAISELTADPDLVYSTERHNLRKDRIEQLHNEFDHLRKISLDQSEKISLMEHKRDEGHTECPKCSHVWSRGFDKVVYDDLIHKHEKTDEALKALSEEMAKLTEEQTTSSYVLSQMNQLSIFARTTPVLSPMWYGLMEQSLVRRRPDVALEYVKATRAQIEHTIELEELQQHQKELTEARKASMEMSGVNQRELLELNDALEVQLRTYQSEVRSLETVIQNLQKCQKAMDYQEKFVPQAEDLMMRRADLINKAEIANHHEAINAIMIHLDGEISQKERLISQIDSQLLLIKTLEDEVAECRRREIVMNKAMNALSPTKGLIARGLTGSINHFIAQANAIIEKVWLHPLTINPIEITEDAVLSLDYKFSFNVDGKPAGSDVSLGSGGQMEIFDLAFMIVSMVRLGMDDTEIFLDEFSIKMDHAHRREALRMITDLLHTSNFSQIFMVSHYESSYGTISNADITVLCPENIQIPSTLAYNVNAKIER